MWLYLKVEDRSYESRYGMKENEKALMTGLTDEKQTNIVRSVERKIQILFLRIIVISD